MEYVAKAIIMAFLLVLGAVCMDALLCMSESEDCHKWEAQSKSYPVTVPEWCYTQGYLNNKEK